MIYTKTQDQTGKWYMAAFEEGVDVPETNQVLTLEDYILLQNGHVFDENGNIVSPDTSITETMVRQEAAMRLEMLGSPYQPQERETWHRQVEEAKAVLVDSTVSVPLLEARATARSLTKTQMAQIVLQKADEYAAAVGKILAAQDSLLATNPIPEDYRDDKYWV